jgi:hypothetical protein
MKDKFYRCDYEKRCSSLLPILELMSRLKDKKDLVLDYAELRKGYEVLLKHFCNDVLSCQNCPLYKKFLEQDVEAEMPSRTCDTSDIEGMTTIIFDKEKINMLTWTEE